MYILYGSRSQQDARARLRRAACGAATPCCLSWADRARRLFILVVHVCDIMIYVRRNAQAVRYVLTKMVKMWGVLGVLFPRMVKVWGLR